MIKLKSLIARSMLVASFAVAGSAVVGCGSDNKAPAYPTAATTDMSANTSGMPLKIPAGATMLAASGYPIVPVTPPSDGTVYVYDADSNTVPLATTGVAGKQMDLSTMQSANSTLNPKDHFRVYFVPANKATTTAVPLGG